VVWAIGILLLALAAIGAAALRCRIAYAIGGVGLLGAGLLVGALEISRPAATDPLDPNPDGEFRLVVLGDSYASGEGALSYFLGTDVPAKNRCHRAPTAYAYLLARELGASLTFAACSGAETSDVTGTTASGRRVGGQYPRSGEDVFGADPQIDVLGAALPADAVVLGIGGNDAGFAEIGFGCATPGPPDCRRSAAYWLHRLESEVHPALVRTYRAVRGRADGATVFVTNYPNPIAPRACDDILLEPEEISFIRDVFTERLNALIAHAAKVARVRLIDLAEAVDGHRICEVPLRRAAVNFIALGRTRGTGLRISVKDLTGLGQGTFHPNPLGHRLMAAPVREALTALREERLPPLPAQPSPEPPPFVPEETGPPVGPHPFPEGTRCEGSEVAVVTPMAVPSEVRELEVTGVLPRSLVCFRDYRGGWRARRAGADGRARVAVRLERPGIGSLNEILTEQKGRTWSKLLVTRIDQEGDGTAPAPPPDRTWAWVAGGGLLAVLAGLGVLAVRRCRRRARAEVTAPPPGPAGGGP
jgi:lysophospholipase L1-like esterase